MLFHGVSNYVADVLTIRTFLRPLVDETCCIIDVRNANRHFQTRFCYFSVLLNIGSLSVDIVLAV